MPQIYDMGPAGLNPRTWVLKAHLMPSQKQEVSISRSSVIVALTVLTLFREFHPANIMAACRLLHAEIVGLPVLLPVRSCRAYLLDEADIMATTV